MERTIGAEAVEDGRPSDRKSATDTAAATQPAAERESGVVIDLREARPNVRFESRVRYEQLSLDGLTPLPAAAPNGSRIGVDAVAGNGDLLTDLIDTTITIDLRSDTPVISLDGGVRQLPLALIERPSLLNATPWKRGLKRVVDLVGALLALVALLPLLLLIALLVRVTSPGPVLFKQTRIGRNGVPFTFFKFRSMYRDAEERREQLAGANEQSGPVFKIRKDPRITPLGRWLRRTSFDELPQLIHVLNGKMSLVGPRPALPEEVARYGPRARRRLAAKPGLTCIWQVSGRSSIGFDTWVSMDIEYIETWSLLLDLRLLLATVPAVLSGRGAW